MNQIQAVGNFADMLQPWPVQPDTHFLATGGREDGKSCRQGNRILITPFRIEVQFDERDAKTVRMASALAIGLSKPMTGFRSSELSVGQSGPTTNFCAFKTARRGWKITPKFIGIYGAGYDD